MKSWYHGLLQNFIPEKILPPRLHHESEEFDFVNHLPKCSVPVAADGLTFPVYSAERAFHRLREQPRPLSPPLPRRSRPRSRFLTQRPLRLRLCPSSPRHAGR